MYKEESLENHYIQILTDLAQKHNKNSFLEISILKIVQIIFLINKITKNYHIYIFIINDRNFIENQMTMKRFQFPYLWTDGRFCMRFEKSKSILLSSGFACEFPRTRCTDIFCSSSFWHRKEGRKEGSRKRRDRARGSHSRDQQLPFRISWQMGREAYPLKILMNPRI